MSDEPNADYTDQRIHHLEMIQGVIARYSDRSARVKHLAILVGWTTLLGFMIGGISVVSESVRPSIDIGIGIIIAVLLIINLEGIITICFFLDIHYSQKAKNFCKFYDRVNAQPSGQRPDFCMTLPPDIALGIAEDIADIEFPIPKPFIKPVTMFYMSLSVCYVLVIATAIFLLSGTL